MAEAVAVAGGGIAMDEARSALATLLGQVIGTLRDFLKWAMAMFEKIVTFAGEHPEAMLLMVGNAVIWMS